MNNQNITATNTDLSNTQIEITMSIANDIDNTQMKDTNSTAEAATDAFEAVVEVEIVAAEVAAEMVTESITAEAATDTLGVAVETEESVTAEVAAEMGTEGVTVVVEDTLEVVVEAEESSTTEVVAAMVTESVTNDASTDTLGVAVEIEESVAADVAAEMVTESVTTTVAEDNLGAVVEAATDALEAVVETKIVAATVIESVNNKSARANSLMREVMEYTKEYEWAEQITNDLLLKGHINAFMKGTTIDGKFDHIANLILLHRSIEIMDMIESEGTGILSHNHYFDATYKTRLRDSEVYLILFPKEVVIPLLSDTRIRGGAQNKKFLIDALAKNIALSEMPQKDIVVITEKLISLHFLEVSNSFSADIKAAKWKNKQQKIGGANEHELQALEFLQDYAVLNDKGTLKFIDTTADSYTTYSKSSLMMMFENMKIEVLNEETNRTNMVNPVAIWMQSRHRKEYDGATFDPSNACDARTYNHFKGFKFGEGKSAVSIDGFKDFVKVVICSANEQMFMIVWSFFAQIFQKPSQKMGTALVLISTEGAGKGTLMRVMGKLMGDYYMSSTDHKRIVSPFNKHLEKVLLFYANEAKFTDSSLTVNKLKNIITETDATSEIKGGDTYACNNYTHLVIDGNDDIPVQQTSESRRFITIYVDHAKIGDLEYWAQLNELIATDGFYESLMYDLLNFDYSEWEHFLRVPPKEEVSIEQIQASFSAIEAWWQHCLEEARIPFVSYELTPEDKLNIRNEDMFQSFKKWCSASNHKHSMDSSTFGKAFREHALGTDSELDTKGKISIDGERKHSHVYETIDKCRDRFVRMKQLNNMDFIGKEWKMCS
ncbi:MAG: DUF5906 domain-containing protein [Sulfurimonas sp.]